MTCRRDVPSAAAKPSCENPASVLAHLILALTGRPLSALDVVTGQHHMSRDVPCQLKLSPRSGPDRLSPYVP